MRNQPLDYSENISRFYLLSNKLYLCHLSSVCLYNLSRDIFATASGFSLFFEIKLHCNDNKCVFTSREIDNNFNPVWNDIQLDSDNYLKTNEFCILVYGVTNEESKKLIGTYNVILKPMFYIRHGIPSFFVKNDGLLLNIRGKFYFFPRIFDLNNYYGSMSVVSCQVLEQKAVYSYSKKTFWILQNQEQIIQKIQSKLNSLVEEIKGSTNQTIVNILEEENLEKNYSYSNFLDVLKDQNSVNSIYDPDYSDLISEMGWLRSEILRIERGTFKLKSQINDCVKERLTYQKQFPGIKTSINSIVKKIEMVRKKLLESSNFLDDLNRKNYIKKQKMFTYLFQIYPFHRSIQNRVINKLFCGIPMPSITQNKIPVYNKNYVNLALLGQLKSYVLLVASTSYACLLSYMIFRILDLSPIFPITFSGSSGSLQDIISSKRYHVSKSLEELNYAYSLLCVNLRQLCRILDVEYDKENNVFNTLYRIINRMSEPKSEYKERESFNMAAELFIERLCVDSVQSLKSIHDDFSDVSRETARTNFKNSLKIRGSSIEGDGCDNPDTYLSESIAEIVARFSSQINF